MKAARGLSRIGMIIAAAAILGIGAAEAAGVLIARRQARDAEVVARVRVFQAAAEGFLHLHGSYPLSASALGASEAADYQPSPEGCTEDGDRICDGYRLGFVLEGRLGILPGGECLAGPGSMECERARP